MTIPKIEKKLGVLQQANFFDAVEKTVLLTIRTK